MLIIHDSFNVMVERLMNAWGATPVASDRMGYGKLAKDLEYFAPPLPIGRSQGHCG